MYMYIIDVYTCIKILIPTYYVYTYTGIYVYLYMYVQYCSEDVVQAIRERDGRDMLTALVDSGADLNLPTPDGSYPIHIAVATGRHETVLFLVNKGASILQQRSVGFYQIHVHVYTYHMCTLLWDM